MSSAATSSVFCRVRLEAGPAAFRKVDGSRIEREWTEVGGEETCRNAPNHVTRLSRLA